MTDKPKPHDIDIEFRLPRALKALAQERAKQRGILLSEYIRRLIAAELGVPPPALRRGAPRKDKPPRVPKKRGRPPKAQ